MDLRLPLRSAVPDDALAREIAGRWRRRDDRGAERRLADPGRGALYQIDTLRADPRREMHTRGG
jgi:hypothetical protein